MHTVISGISQCSFTYYTCTRKTHKMGHCEAFEKWVKETFIRAKNLGKLGATWCNPRIVRPVQGLPIQSSDVRFAQDNPRIVPICTLHITYLLNMYCSQVAWSDFFTDEAVHFLYSVHVFHQLGTQGSGCGVACVQCIYCR